MTRSVATGRPWAEVVSVVAAACLTAGCYSEVPVRWDAAPSNREVDVALVASETAPLAATLGPRAQAVAGRVTARGDSTLTVAVTEVTRTTGVAETWPGSEVVLPVRVVERVTVRRLSAVRTGLLGAAIAGAGLLVGAIATGVDFSGGGGTPTPGRQ